MHKIPKTIIAATTIIITALISGCGQQPNSQNQNLNTKSTQESDIAFIEAGGYHSVALKKDGTVWAWGRNLSGQLGDGLTVDRYEPSKIDGLEHIIALSGKADHTLAVTESGQVWAWGYNPDGQIDAGDEVHSTPVLIQGLNNIVSVSAGGSFSLALDKQGDVWSWGANIYGQLGNGNNEDNPLPQKVTSIHDVVQIEAGGDFALALTKDGVVWAWGRNTLANLGMETIKAKVCL
ncbi:RCC1 domain-containing protein [Cohnella soli]|uniref:RCC1 domain-containing protein n=1 Tax=Cohnella soli TaxID=425005 RepID=A0ABW0HSR7_9BACL